MGKKTEPLATMKVPIGVRLLISEIASQTGETEEHVVGRLVIQEMVELLQVGKQSREAGAAECSSGT